ncbi:hypothetical protein ACFYXH_17815 [Streptomyces sp. NPDC002730]|uniref:hypothetical protein n=1 Tax=Streptomyces sp. NPDC002730 TaxID=3364662 RepID=UPI0036C88F36
MTCGPLARQGGRAAEQGRSWRWWQVASDGLSIRDEDFQDTPEKIATHAAVTRMSLEQRVELYRRYLDAQSVWGRMARDRLQLRISAAADRRGDRYGAGSRTPESSRDSG